MERLNIYTMDFSIEELKGIACLKTYELCEHKINLNDRSNLQQDVPAIFIFRNPPTATNIWRYIRTIRNRKMNAAFLLLISRKDFMLLYGACQNGITAVQMDPASKNEMDAQLRRCLEKIAEVKQSLRDRALLEDYEFEKQQKIMERLLMNIMEKPQEVELLLPEINKRYNTRLGEGIYQAFVVSVNRSELCGGTSHFLKEVTLHAIHSLALARDIILGYREPYGLIGLVYYGENRPLEERKAEYRKLWNQILNLQEFYGDFQVTIGVGEPVEGISAIAASLQKAAYVQEYRMATDQYVLFTEEVQAPKELSEYVPERRIKELIRFVSMGEVQALKDWFEEFYANEEPKFDAYPPAYAKFCWEVYSACKSMSVFPEKRFFHLHHIFDGKERNRQLEILLLEICHMMQPSLGTDSDLAAQAIAYMKVHFAEPINLDYMAEKCGLSTSYFSRKFKEQTGEKYIDVLTDIRVSEAKRLLSETDLPVLAIVEEVGYCDEKHFRRVFCKNTGMNPLAYRKKARLKA